MKRIFTLFFALLSMFAIIGSASAADVVFNVTVPSPTYECWLVGNFNGWNNNDKKMTKVDDTHYTITLDDATFASGVTVDNLEYKYLSGGGDWAYVEKYADGSEMKANRAYKLGKVNTHTNDAGVVDDTSAPGTNGNDIVARWATVYNPNVPPMPKTVTISVLVPATVIQCYIVGTFNNWAIPTDTTKMTLVQSTVDGKIFSISFFTVDANKLQYKFCAGPAWDYEQTSSVNINYPDPTLNTAEHVVSEFKAYFDPTKVGDIKVTATVPPGTTDVWVNGSWIGWNFPGTGNNGTGGVKCTKNPDGTFSFTAPNVLNIEYKMYNGQSWNNVEVNELGIEVSNRKAVYPADANINITVVGWKTPQALPELNADKYKIYTIANTIVVEGVLSQVDIYDASGRNIQSTKLTGKFTSHNLKSGLYILKVDGATKKVSLR